jgi:hypothetical protein
MGTLNYKIKDDVISRNNQDGTVILMRMDDGNSFFKINGIAAVVWKEMQSSKSIEEIQKTILENYNTNESQVKSDVEKFVSDLAAKGLISKN